MSADREDQGPAPLPAVPPACGLARRTGLAGAWLTLAIAATMLACDDGCLTEPCRNGDPTGGIVSDPVQSGAGAPGLARSSGFASATNLVYVSLPPDSVPQGEIAEIRNSRLGTSVATAMADGGFDPVALEAAVGDRLDLEIELNGGSQVRITMEVPAARKPRVVRTRPITKKRDVVLNAIPTVIFSEPIAVSTAGNIRLLRGTTPVSGKVVVSADGLRAEFQPAQLLAANTNYILLIPEGVTDVSGDHLESALGAEFTTGTAVAEASAMTQQAALFVVPVNGVLRAAEFSAVLLDDGSVTGGFHIYFPEIARKIVGRISCFATDGNAAWIAGVVDSATNMDHVGLEYGWRAVDQGAPSGGVPDQLSLAHPLVEGGVRSAQEWCATTPVTDPWYGEIVLHDLTAGDIVLTGDAPLPPRPPPPPPPQRPADGMSQIAFFTPGGAIAVRQADGAKLATLVPGSEQYNPAWSPDGTRIAFQRHEQGGSNIYTVNWDGSALTRITSGPQTDQDPAWSPDGARIAFLRAGSIHVMNADGSGITRVSNAGYDSHPSWSPDGARVVFASSRSGVNAIHVMNADGSNVIQLTSDSAVDYNPSWSPDGSKIVFQRNPYGVGSIYVMNPDGSELTRVVNGQTPAWSPDGKRIIYELFGITWVMSDGSGMTRLGGGFYPDWSPVGSMPPEPQPFRSIEKVSGDQQTGVPGDSLPQPLVVRVVRDDGTPEAGVTIRWNGWGSEPPDPWALSANTSTTSPDGSASVRVKVGSSPEVRIRAALVDGTARVGEVTFTASNGTPPVQPARIERWNWGSLNEMAVTESTNRYTVVVYDGAGHPLPDVPIAWKLTAGGGEVSPELDTTVSDPEWSGTPLSTASHLLGSEEGVTTVMATAFTLPGLPEVAFTTTVVTARVDVRCGGFMSDSVVVPPGRTVGWVWLTRCGRSGTNPHNVAFEDDSTAGSPTLSVGQFTRRFEGPPRTVRYRCTRHSSDFDGPAREVGRVIVR